MKKIILPKILFTGCMFIMLSVHGQPGTRSEHDQPQHSTYAVTDSVQNGTKWNFLRTLDLRTGAYSSILIRLLNNNELQPPAGTPNSISWNGIAAMAYDKKNKRLYYTPMLTDKLYYIDLRTMNKYLVSNHFTGLMPKTNDQSNIITRMVIGDDDKGYALTNDGRHLIRFRTNNNPGITDLGSLVDAPGNNESVHNLCSSFGGDLIADDDDDLYLFTSRNHVFKINTRTKVARYTGTITDLPANFTTSGAVVDKSEEKIIIVSAADSSDVYAVNLKTLVAKPLHANRPRLPSDLANGSILKDKDRNDHRDNTFVFDDSKSNENILLYPNPVIAKEFKINFSDTKAGTYTVKVMDVEGKSITSKVVTTSGKGSIVSVNLPEQISSGMYIVRVTDADNKAWYSGKIFVE